MQGMNTLIFGLDVHKKTITIAIADQNREKKPRSDGTIVNDLDALDKFCRKMVSTASRRYFVYEAGPFGYGIYLPAFDRKRIRLNGGSPISDSRKER